MAEKKTSIKHLQISKGQSTILAVIASATIISVFCLFATKALVSKGLYQRRALNARHHVADQLKSNYTAAQALFNQYKVFANADPNLLGGVKDGSGNQDGDNPRIVLDALPSKYDAPALAASLEKILLGQSITIGSLSVTDDPSGNSDQAQANPAPKSISFSFDGATTYSGAQQLMQKFEQSIRPFDVNSMQISGTDNSMHVNVQMTTYFQPAKSLDLSPTKVVK